VFVFKDLRYGRFYRQFGTDRLEKQRTDLRQYTGYFGDKTLACIDHKSLEICDRCRLWQRNSPATPEDSAAVFEIRVQTGCLVFRISITALKVTRSVCLRAF